MHLMLLIWKKVALVVGLKKMQARPLSQKARLHLNLV
jgi:hypothetical protein